MFSNYPPEGDNEDLFSEEEFRAFRERRFLQRDLSQEQFDRDIDALEYDRANRSERDQQFAFNGIAGIWGYEH